MLPFENSIVHHLVKVILTKQPSIDLSACSKCGGCIEVAPGVFRWHEIAGYIEVCDLDIYDEQLVDEAIKWCPENCIYWEFID